MFVPSFKMMGSMSGVAGFESLAPEGSVIVEKNRSRRRILGIEHGHGDRVHSTSIIVALIPDFHTIRPGSNSVRTFQVRFGLAGSLKVTYSIQGYSRDSSPPISAILHGEETRVRSYVVAAAKAASNGHRWTEQGFPLHSPPSSCISSVPSKEPPAPSKVMRRKSAGVAGGPPALSTRSRCTAFR